MYICVLCVFSHIYIYIHTYVNIVYVYIDEYMMSMYLHGYVYVERLGVLRRRPRMAIEVLQPELVPHCMGWSRTGPAELSRRFPDAAGRHCSGPIGPQKP